VKEIGEVPFHKNTNVYGGVSLGSNGLRAARLSNFNEIGGCVGEFETFCGPEDLGKQIHLFNRRYRKARKHYIKKLFSFIWKQVYSFYFNEKAENPDSFQCEGIEGHGFYTNFTFVLPGYSSYVYRNVGFLTETEFNAIAEMWKNYDMI
jgi:hypothetical protein